ncbi:MAG: CPBP family glutamic-type intramembrane protease [Gemmatirosa sp.]
MRGATSSRADRWLWPVAALAGLLFFVSLGRLWPLAATDLSLPRATLVARAAGALARQGILARAADTADYAIATRLATDEGSLDYIERTLGRDAAQTLIAGGAPLVGHEVLLKRAGDPDARWAMLHPDGALRGWSRGVQDDAEGARLAVEGARAIAADALTRGLGGALTVDTASDGGATSLADAWRTAPWRETGAASRERPSRTDHTFTYERLLRPRGGGTYASVAPATPSDARDGAPLAELRERATILVSGDRVTFARRYLVVPASGDRAARARAAPVQALQTAGFALLVVGAIGALAVFLLRLRDGSVRLGRAAYWSAIVFACAFLTGVLADYALLAGWDPLWPRWVARFTSLAGQSQGTAWMFVLLFAFIAAGDALDREVTGAGDAGGRGATLWRLGRGGITDPAVGLASARGFAVGLTCGGVMAATVWVLERTTGAYAGIQPTGFFFYALNSSMPSVATLLFFTNIALLEELGYRLFAGSWLLHTLKRPWIAIVVPAVVYGLTHTGLSFLPPQEPFWGRALVMSLVGCVWGWAFLRWDALTVVTSHLTADLFIFNWPRLASAHPDVRLAALLTVSAPLVPALVAGVARLVRGRGALAAVTTEGHHGAVPAPVPRQEPPA